MSQQPPASGPSSSLPQQALSTSATQAQIASQGQQYHSSVFEATPHDRSLARPAAYGVPSDNQLKRPAGSEASAEEPPPRSLGVQSILNPAQYEPTTAQARPRFLDSQRSINVSVPPGQRPSVTSSPRLLQSQEYTQPRESSSASGVHPPRRTLTPKSPRHRATSFAGKLNPPTGTINATEAPFAPSVGPSGRVYAAESGYRGGSDVPAVPAGATLSRFQGGYPQTSGPNPSDHGRRQSGGAAAGPSQSASPSTSHSSYSQFSQTSPAQGYDLPPPSAASYHQGSYGQSASQPGSHPSELAQAQFDTSGSIGPGNYSMSFQTDQGTIHVPVDITAASRLADEKRRRNAGASARFRQRRKEKERESSQTISKLEQTLRDVTEEREFYRIERNYFRDAYLRTVGPAAVAPRPTSPRLRRLPPPIEADSPGGWQDEDQAGSSDRNTRRRTSNFQPGYSIAPPPSSSLPGTLPSPLPKPSTGPPPGPHGPHGPPGTFSLTVAGTQFQPSYLEPKSTGPPTSLPPAPLPPRTTSYDPFRRENYDRSWNPRP